MSAAEKKKYIKELQKQGISPSAAKKMAETKAELEKKNDR